MRSKLQKVADTFADRRTAGFARQEMRDAASLEARRESVGLCGLSASFGSLERDERQSRHDFTCAQRLRFSSGKSGKKSEAPKWRHPERSLAKSKDPLKELNVMLRDSSTSLGMTAKVRKRRNS
jgi:hypothetical protein